MASLHESLQAAMQIDGAAGVAVVDTRTGACLGMAGDAPDLEIEAAANCDILKREQQLIALMDRKDAVEDILITMGRYHHIIRPISGSKGLMLFLALHRTKSNLGLARREINFIERCMEI